MTRPVPGAITPSENADSIDSSRRLSGSRAPGLALGGALLSLALLAGWAVLDGLAGRISLPLAFSYVEGFNVNDAARLAQGKTLYADPSQPPFVVSVYTPLYTSLVALLIALGLPGLVSGRLVSLLSVTLVAGVIGISGKRQTRAVASVTACLLLLAPL